MYEPAGEARKRRNTKYWRKSSTRTIPTPCFSRECAMCLLALDNIRNFRLSLMLSDNETEGDLEGREKSILSKVHRRLIRLSRSFGE
jgi:hypothetical protein